MPKTPNLDETTRRIAERMLRMPPKPHDQMKLGRAKRGVSPAKRKRVEKPR
jgi:hypothetical protein